MDGAVQLLARTLTEAEARQVAAWAYPPPFDLYDAGPGAVDLLLPSRPRCPAVRPRP